jgi:outer membrane murein-binding lipoprotein Lpp
MKTLITAIVLAATATSASAFTCKNTVEMINGEWSYTTSQCGNQAPASAEVLEMITYTANNPPKDLVEEEVIAPVVVAPVVEPTKLEKLNTRLDNMMSRKAKLQDKIKAATGQKKKALKDKRTKLNKQINKVNNRISKLNGTSSSKPAKVDLPS